MLAKRSKKRTSTRRTSRRFGGETLENRNLMTAVNFDDNVESLDRDAAADFVQVGDGLDGDGLENRVEELTIGFTPIKDS